MTGFRQGNLGLTIACFFLLGLTALGGITAAETPKGPTVLKLDAQLLWGTDDVNSPDPSHKEVDPRMRKRLQSTFKWKNYFLVNHQSVALPLKKTTRIKLSSDCEVEITNLGDSQIEAKLFGKGEFQVRKKHMMKPDEIFSLGGGAKNGTAWFVVFTLGEK